MRQQVKKYEEEYVQIGGISQYLLHYKSKPENPVIVYLHGGPGQSEGCMAYVIEEYAQRNYSIVYYDQRGAGKTYLKNRKSVPNTEILLQDLLEIVQYIKKKYCKDKVIILGHSWGSVLGSLFTLTHPEQVLAYIGTGQVINTLENEKVGYLKLKKAIEASGNQKDLNKMINIGEYPGSGELEIMMPKLQKIRSLQMKYGITTKIDKATIQMFFRSPITKFRDALALLLGGKMNITVMKELMKLDLASQGLHYEVPIYYVLGADDQLSPVEISQEYFDKIEAPHKELYLIPHAGHMAALDNVADFRKAICSIATNFATDTATSQKTNCQK